MTDQKVPPKVMYVVHYESCGFVGDCMTVFVCVVDTEKEAEEVCKTDPDYWYHEVPYGKPS